MRSSYLTAALLLASLGSFPLARAEKPRAADAIADFLDAFAAPKLPISHAPSCGCVGPSACPTCGVEVQCGCVPTCVADPTCGCDTEPTCGIDVAPAFSFEHARPVRMRLRSHSLTRKVDPWLTAPRPGMMYGVPVGTPAAEPPAPVAPAAPAPVVDVERLPEPSSIPRPRVEALPPAPVLDPTFEPDSRRPAPPKPLSKTPGTASEFQFVPRTPPMLPRTPAVAPTRVKPVSPAPNQDSFDPTARRSAYDIQRTGGVVTVAPEIRPALRLVPVEAVPLSPAGR